MTSVGALMPPHFWGGIRNWQIYMEVEQTWFHHHQRTLERNSEREPSTQIQFRMGYFCVCLQQYYVFTLFHMQGFEYWLDLRTCISKDFGQLHAKIDSRVIPLHRSMFTVLSTLSFVVMEFWFRLWLQMKNGTFVAAAPAPFCYFTHLHWKHVYISYTLIIA